jgi:3-oxoacyl-[acyl-carrier protein] reductase
MVMQRTALVTGGSRGIGLATARALGGAGHRVGLLSRDASRLAEAAEVVGTKTVWRSADVGDEIAVKEAVDEIAAELGGLDVVVTASGFGIHFGASTPYVDAVRSWDSEVGVNLRGAFCTIQAAVPHLRRNGGRIMSISSIAAYSGGSSPGAAGYAAAKAGLLGLIRGLARELTPHGTTVNAIAPGFIATEFHGDNAAAAAEKVVGAIPAGRVGQPEDVAGVAAFLASPAAGYISGQVIHVNGGWWFGS